MKIGYNSLLSFEIKDEDTIILRRERICEHCKDKDDELYGLVAVDKKLYNIIQMFADKELEGSMNGWLLMCYYYEKL